jgi:hypothetical protein
MIRRHELTDKDWERIAPLEKKAFAGLFGMGQHQPHPHATNHSTVHPS